MVIKELGLESLVGSFRKHTFLFKDGKNAHGLWERDESEFLKHQKRAFPVVHQ